MNMVVADVIQNIREAISATDAITWIATLTAVIYVILALKENILCWSFGIISSSLSIYVYYQELLWYEAILNFAYVILGFYGWMVWRKKSASESTQIISKIKISLFLIILSGGVLVSLVLGYISKTYTASTLPFADAAITTLSIIATWMTAKKYLENWIVWIVVDGFAAGVYIYKGPELYLFALLFIFYSFIAIAGYYSWRRKLIQ